MPFSFLIPLAIALVVGSLGYQSQEEIVTIVLSIVAFLCLILSVVLALWVGQIFILMAGLAGMRYLCDRHSCHNALKQSDQ